MLSDDWKLTLLAREATKNVLARRARLFSLLAIAILAGVAQVAFLAFESVALRAQLDTLAAQGRNVVAFESSDRDAPIDISRVRCEALADVSGVQFAGLFEPDPRASFVQLGRDVAIARASDTLVPNLREYDAVIGAALTPSRGELRLTVQDGTSEEGTLNAIVGGTPPGIGADAVVLRPLSPLDVSGSTCFAVLDRLADAQSMIPLLQAQLVVSGGAVVGNPQLRLPLDSVTVFLQRPTIYAPVALGILGGVIAGIVTLLRSSELAAYRFAGTSPRSLLIILTMEQMLMGGVLFASGTAAALVLAPHLMSVMAAVIGVATAGAAWIVVASAISVIAAVRNPTRLAKDR